MKNYTVTKKDSAPFTCLDS